VGGVRLHYLERGQGPAVVLLHGNGATAADFVASGILDRAAERHRVIVFDRPGAGYSARPRRRIWTPKAQAALLGKALDRLAVQRPVVLGHSWGTLVALALALDRPAETRGLVLLSGYYFPRFRADVALLSLAALPGLGALLRHTLLPVLGRLTLPYAVRKIFAPLPVSPRFAAFPLALSLRPSQLRATLQDTALMIPAALALSRRYADIGAPAVIMAGRGDEIVDCGRQSKRLGDVLPASELRLADGIGHMLHYALPDAVVAAIEDAARPDAMPRGHAGEPR
jgi:pimeloyl-ACP methyl ester carboxylesterase